MSENSCCDQKMERKRNETALQAKLPGFREDVKKNFWFE